MALWFAVAFGILSLIAPAGGFAATQAQKCAGAKLRADGATVSGTATCHQKALLKGVAVDPACVQKATDKLRTLFAKADAAGACPGDVAVALAAVDACVTSFLGVISGAPPCAAAKVKAAGKKTSAKAQCAQKATLAGAPIDPLCLAKAETKFTTAMAKADGLGVCTATAPQLEALVDTCLVALPPTTTTTTTTPTTTTTTTTLPGGPVAVDFTAMGYYSSGAIFHAGMPSASYLPLPTVLTHAQLAQLQTDCIDRINGYRDGTFKFTGGSSDPGVPKPALTHLMGNDRCSSAQALGDLLVNNGAGGCAGAHTNAFSCPLSGGGGQNSCCARSGSTYSAIRAQLFSCLQQMWDEGIGLPDNAPFTGANGHWHNMRNQNLHYAHCGFGFSAGGVVWMNQDFSGGAPGGVSLVCSCAGKNIGDPDGCGGLCVTGN